MPNSQAAPEEGVVLVPLTRGLTARVDAADLPLIEDLKWYATSHGYAAAKVKTPEGHRQVYMHALLMGADMVDHADGDRLNNSRANLRACTVSQNQQNRRASWGASRYKGVHVIGNHGLWRVQIQKDGHRLCLGYYEDEERAARVYDTAARVFFGRFACTNRDLGLLAA